MEDEAVSHQPDLFRHGVFASQYGPSLYTTLSRAKWRSFERIVRAWYQC